MGSVIIVVWLLAVLVVLFALVGRFDPEAHGPNAGPRAIPPNPSERPTSSKKSAPSEDRANGGPT